MTYNIHKYCPVCGSKCKIERRVDYYETGTGKPIVSYWRTCPKAKRSDNIVVDILLGLVNYHDKDVWAGGYDPTDL